MAGKKIDYMLFNAIQKGSVAAKRVYVIYMWTIIAMLLFTTLSAQFEIVYSVGLVITKYSQLFHFVVFAGTYLAVTIFSGFKDSSVNGIEMDNLIEFWKWLNKIAMSMLAYNGTALGLLVLIGG